MIALSTILELGSSVRSPSSLMIFKLNSSRVFPVDKDPMKSTAPESTVDFEREASVLPNEKVSAVLHSCVRGGPLFRGFKLGQIELENRDEFNRIELAAISAKTLVASSMSGIFVPGLSSI
jgi:hypothetical protein